MALQAAYNPRHCWEYQEWEGLVKGVKVHLRRRIVGSGSNKYRSYLIKVGAYTRRALSRPKADSYIKELVEKCQNERSS